MPSRTVRKPAGGACAAGRSAAAVGGCGWMKAAPTEAVAKKRTMSSLFRNGSSLTPGDASHLSPRGTRRLRRLESRRRITPSRARSSVGERCFTRERSQARNPPRPSGKPCLSESASSSRADNDQLSTQEASGGSGPAVVVGSQSLSSVAVRGNADGAVSGRQDQGPGKAIRGGLVTKAMSRHVVLVAGHRARRAAVRLRHRGGLRGTAVYPPCLRACQLVRQGAGRQPPARRSRRRGTRAGVADKFGVDRPCS